MARPLGLEPRTLCLEGKVNSAQALYLQSIYASFLRKSSPAAPCTLCAAAKSLYKKRIKAGTSFGYDLGVSFLLTAAGIFAFAFAPLASTDKILWCFAPTTW